MRVVPNWFPNTKSKTRSTNLVKKHHILIDNVSFLCPSNIEDYKTYSKRYTVSPSLLWIWWPSTNEDYETYSKRFIVSTSLLWKPDFTDEFHNFAQRSTEFTSLKVFSHQTLKWKYHLNERHNYFHKFSIHSSNLKGNNSSTWENWELLP